MRAKRIYTGLLTTATIGVTLQLMLPAKKSFSN